MSLKMNYKQCLVELDEVLEQLSNENLNKIPIELRNAIKREKDINYKWKYDKRKLLNQQNLNRKTIAMLSYLNMEYLLIDKQKDAMKKIHDYYEKINEEKIREKYNPGNIFKTKNISDLNSGITNDKQSMELIEYKETKFNKIIKFIKKIFTKK